LKKTWIILLSKMKPELNRTKSVYVEVPQCVRMGYGTGHVLNDMCASMWFTYLLLFFNRVLGFSNSLCGIIMVVGQVSDGIFTAIIGYLQDYGKDWWLCRRYNKRKSWHLVGTVCVLASFPFIFMSCIGCDKAPAGVQIVYYCGFVIVFQFGWACVQISHLALIPDLSSSEKEHTSLTSYRYSAKILSSLMVYMSMWAFLGPLSSDDEEPIGQNNITTFRDVAFICVGVGTITSLVFHVAVRLTVNSTPKLVKITDTNLAVIPPSPSDVLEGNEAHLRKSIEHQSSTLSYVCLSTTSIEYIPMALTRSTRHTVFEPEPMWLSNWLREGQFWKVSLLYICARLYINLSQAYIILYLEVTLELKPINLAIMPLVMFLASLLTSASMSILAHILGKRGTFIVSCFIGLGGSVWVWFGDSTNSSYTTWEIYIVAVIIGFSGTAMLITSIAAVADLIGAYLESSASVFGLMSFAEKLANALAFGLIQELVPDGINDTQDYYRDILVFVCGATAILPILILMTMVKFGLNQGAKVSIASVSPTAKN